MEEDYYVNISGLDKSEVLAALVNYAKDDLSLEKLSKVQNFNPSIFLQILYSNQKLSVERAREILTVNSRTDYISGIPIKIDFSDDVLYTRLYDRDHGKGKARKIIELLSMSKK